MDRLASVREGFFDRLSILSIKNIKKISLTDESITSMKMRPKVSIDTIPSVSIHRSIADCAHLQYADKFGNKKSRLFVMSVWLRYGADKEEELVSGPLNKL
jgi:hypothetical protein